MKVHLATSYISFGFIWLHGRHVEKQWFFDVQTNRSLNFVGKIYRAAVGYQIFECIYKVNYLDDILRFFVKFRPRNLSKNRLLNINLG